MVFLDVLSLSSLSLIVFSIQFEFKHVYDFCPDVLLMSLVFAA